MQHLLQQDVCSRKPLGSVCFWHLLEQCLALVRWLRMARRLNWNWIGVPVSLRACGQGAICVGSPAFSCLPSEQRIHSVVLLMGRWPVVVVSNCSCSTSVCLRSHLCELWVLRAAGRCRWSGWCVAFLLDPRCHRWYGSTWCCRQCCTDAALSCAVWSVECRCCRRCCWWCCTSASCRHPT